MNEKLQSILTSQPIIQGERNWYKFCSLTFVRLKGYITENLLLKYILHHIIDTEYLYNKELINYIYYNKPLSEFEQKIKEYLDTFIIERGNKKAILFYSPLSKKPVKYNIFDETKIRGVLPTEHEMFFPKRNPERRARPIINIEKINDIVGFMTIFKSEHIIFKIKEMKKKRNKGARCDQITKKLIVPILKGLEFNNIYKDLTQKIPGEKKIKKIGSQQLCCELELILRYYDDIKKKGIRWFLPTVDIKLSEIE